MTDLEPRDAAGAPPATLWRRFMAMTYESIILFGVLFFFGYGFSALVRFQGHPGGKHLAFQIYLFLVLGAYFVYFWSRGRRTLPMKTMDLILHDARNQPISVARAIARYVALAACLLVPLALAKLTGQWAWSILILLPLAWALIDGKNRTLYDVAAGTRLVVVPIAKKVPGL